MKIFVHNSSIGHYPVGTAAVVIADTREDAAQILALELQRVGLGKGNDPETLYHGLSGVDPDIPHAVILCDGDY